MNSSMRTLLAAGGGAAAAFAITLPFLPAHATTSTTELTALLNGANEVPPADPNGTGEAHIFISDSRPNKLCFVLQVDQIGRPTMAHIHRGEAGVVGPVRVPFQAPADGDSAGCVETPLATRIMNNPQNWYVNVHNAKFPGGAIRGQLG